MYQTIIDRLDVYEEFLCKIYSSVNKNKIFAYQPFVLRNIKNQNIGECSLFVGIFIEENFYIFSS